MCIGLLEEVTLDCVPSIVIGPKGDITYLLLKFPEMRKEDFAPWINAEDVAKKGLSRITHPELLFGLTSIELKAN